MTRRLNWPWMISGVLTLIPGIFALYYGVAMTFMVPGNVGEPFFSADRIRLGMVPLAVGVAVLSLAGRFFLRAMPSEARRSVTALTMAADCVLGALVAMWLFFMIASLFTQK